MKRLILLSVILGGCSAYDPKMVSEYTDAKLCITRYDTGSISGIPEKNAQAEIDRRGGIDCKPIMEAYWRQIDRAYLMMNAMQPPPTPIQQQPNRMTNCSSRVSGKTIDTYCY